MKSKKRSKLIEKAIRNSWSSLESHLSWTRGKKVKQNGSNTFHKKCVREYAETILILSKLY